MVPGLDLEDEALLAENDDVQDTVPPVPDEEEQATESDVDVTGASKAVLDFLNELVAEGITVADLKALRDNAATSTQQQALYSLSGAWSVPVAEATERMAMVKEYWETLPKDEQKRLDSVEGAQEIWGKIETRNRAGTVGKGHSSGSVTQPKHLYTEQQIDAMSETERQKHDARITYAYANGLVKA